MLVNTSSGRDKKETRELSAGGWRGGGGGQISPVRWRVRRYPTLSRRRNPFIMYSAVPTEGGGGEQKRGGGEEKGSA
jgi:hypothetical protein